MTPASGRVVPPAWLGGYAGVWLGGITGVWLDGVVGAWSGCDGDVCSGAGAEVGGVVVPVCAGAVLGSLDAGGVAPIRRRVVGADRRLDPAAGHSAGRLVGIVG